MRLELGPRLEGTCEACGEHYQEHAADCPRGAIIALCEQFLHLRCPACNEHHVERNNDDWLECERCHAQFATGLGIPYDADKLPRETIIDLVHNRTWNVVRLPDKGDGHFPLRTRIAELELAEHEAKKARKK